MTHDDVPNIAALKEPYKSPARPALPLAWLRAKYGFSPMTR